MGGADGEYASPPQARVREFADLSRAMRSLGIADSQATDTPVICGSSNRHVSR